MKPTRRDFLKISAEGLLSIPFQRFTQQYTVKEYAPHSLVKKVVESIKNDRDEYGEIPIYGGQSSYKTYRKSQPVGDRMYDALYIDGSKPGFGSDGKSADDSIGEGDSLILVISEWGMNKEEYRFEDKDLTGSPDYLDDPEKFKMPDDEPLDYEAIYGGDLEGFEGRVYRRKLDKLSKALETPRLQTSPLFLQDSYTDLISA